MTPDIKISDAERDAFEAAMRTAGFDSDSYYLPPRAGVGGEYDNDLTQCRWEGWQLARANQQPSAQWIAVSERLPEIDMSKAEYMRFVRVLMCHAGSPESTQSGRYISHGLARTEKGRLPRFEDSFGRIATPSHWMPHPNPPTR